MGSHWDPRLQEDGSGRYGLPCRVMGRKGDAQGATGPIVVGIQEALAVPRVIDRIVPGGKKNTVCFVLGTYLVVLRKLIPGSALRNQSCQDSGDHVGYRGLN